MRGFAFTSIMKALHVLAYRQLQGLWLVNLF